MARRARRHRRFASSRPSPVPHLAHEKGPFPGGSGPLLFSPSPLNLLPPRDLAVMATRTTGSLGRATPERRAPGTLRAYQVAAADVFGLSRRIRIVSDPVDDGEVPWTIWAYVQNASRNVDLVSV
jgi:hypothetical protein